MQTLMPREYLRSGSSLDHCRTGLLGGAGSSLDVRPLCTPGILAARPGTRVTVARPSRGHGWCEGGCCPAPPDPEGPAEGGALSRPLPYWASHVRLHCWETPTGRKWGVPPQVQLQLWEKLDSHKQSGITVHDVPNPLLLVKQTSKKKKKSTQPQKCAVHGLARPSGSVTAAGPVPGGRGSLSRTWPGPHVPRGAQSSAQPRLGAFGTGHVGVWLRGHRSPRPTQDPSRTRP